LISIAKCRAQHIRGRQQHGSYVYTETRQASRTLPTGARRHHFNDASGEHRACHNAFVCQSQHGCWYIHLEITKIFPWSAILIFGEIRLPHWIGDCLDRLNDKVTFEKSITSGDVILGAVSNIVLLCRQGRRQ
jgi:hypothetical protein